MARLHWLWVMWLGVGGTLATAARGDIDLTFPNETVTAPLGAVVQLTLVASSDTMMNATTSGMDILITWDQTKLKLLGVTPTCPSMGSPWFACGFFTDPDGLNMGVGGLPNNDGNAKFTVFSPPIPPTQVPPPPGLVVTSFRFQCLAATNGTVVQIPPTLGMFSRTQIFDGITPNLDVTGDISSNVTVRIINCPLSGPDDDEDGFPNACDICPDADDSLDDDFDGVPDGCDQCPDFDDAIDCNTNGVPDGCEGPDCNTNGNPDVCDIDIGGGMDVNMNGVPDECDGPPCATCPGDLNGDSSLDGDDIQLFIDCLINGTGSCACAEMDANPGVDSADVAIFVSILLTPTPCL